MKSSFDISIILPTYNEKENVLLLIKAIHHELMTYNHEIIIVDILLMPTVREGFSLSVLEAIASGLPVVASNCSSLPEQIDNGKGGFISPIGDVEDFADKINLLSDSPELRREMGEYNRWKVESHSTVQQMFKKYEELFEEILN